MLRNNNLNNPQVNAESLHADIKDLIKVIEKRIALRKSWCWIIFQSMNKPFKTLLKKFYRLLDDRHRDGWLPKEQQEKKLIKIMRKIKHYSNEVDRVYSPGSDLEEIRDLCHGVQMRYRNHLSDSLPELKELADQEESVKLFYDKLEKHRQELLQLGDLLPKERERELFGLNPSLVRLPQQIEPMPTPPGMSAQQKAQNYLRNL